MLVFVCQPKLNKGKTTHEINNVFVFLAYSPPHSPRTVVVVVQSARWSGPVAIYTNSRREKKLRAPKASSSDAYTAYLTTFTHVVAVIAEIVVRLIGPFLVSAVRYFGGTVILQV